MLAEHVEPDTNMNAVELLGLDVIREKISLFGGLTDKQLDLVRSHLKLETVTCGQSVFDQGQLPCNVYIVLSGEICLEIVREDNSKSTMHYVPGDCFGETAVIGIQPQLGKAKAKMDSQVLVMSRTCLLELANVDQGLFGMLMMNIAREVSRRLHSVATTPVTQADYPILRA